MKQTFFPSLLAITECRKLIERCQQAVKQATIHEFDSATGIRKTYVGGVLVSTIKVRN